jgi:hypothetical protein
MATNSAVSGIKPDVPMHESFENSIGPFTENWGVDFSTFGEARFFGNQYSTAGMKEPGADPSIGHGYGTYTVNAMLTGKTAGSAIMLWPGDNKYPGPEIDLAELKPDGTGHQYATVHWNESGQNDQQQYYFDDVQSGVFHNYQAVWEPGKITLSIDHHIVAVVTSHVPADYNHGGMNETFAFLNNNDATSLVVRDVSFVPLGGTALDTPLTASVVSTPVAPTNPSVFRFYDTATGGHFFTASTVERDTLISTTPSLTYEGVGFHSLDPAAVGAVPVFRFYNPGEDSHFFTASSAERDSVIANYPTYKFEGVAFYALTVARDGTAPVYRYYDTHDDGSFLTASAAEKANVDAAASNLHLDGIAFYVPTSDFLT